MHRGIKGVHQTSSDWSLRKVHTYLHRSDSEGRSFVVFEFTEMSAYIVGSYCSTVRKVIQIDWQEKFPFEIPSCGFFWSFLRQRLPAKIPIRATGCIRIIGFRVFRLGRDGLFVVGRFLEIEVTLSRHAYAQTLQQSPLNLRQFKPI